MFIQIADAPLTANIGVVVAFTMLTIDPSMKMDEEVQAIGYAPDDLGDEDDVIVIIIVIVIIGSDPYWCTVAWCVDPTSRKPQIGHYSGNGCRIEQIKRFQTQQI